MNKKTGKYRRSLAAFLSFVLTAGVFTAGSSFCSRQAFAKETGKYIGAFVLKDNLNTVSAATVYYGNGGAEDYYAWRVIGFDGEKKGITLAEGGEGKITLFSKGSMDRSSFYSFLQPPVYDGSNLKSKVEVISGELSSEEAGAVGKRTLVSGEYKGDDTDCVSEKEVKDALMWPLSTKEALTVDRNIRMINPEQPKEIYDYWWLRSPGYENQAAYVDHNGYVQAQGHDVTLALRVRPAFNINLSSVIFTSPIPGSPNEYKLTVPDDKICVEMKGRFILSGNTVTVPYELTGEHKDNVDRVSVVITDGKYSVDSGWDDKASDGAGDHIEVLGGDDSFTIPEEYRKTTLGTDYHVYIIAEDINEGKKTDYAGIPLELRNPVPGPSVLKKNLNTVSAATVYFGNGGENEWYVIGYDEEEGSIPLSEGGKGKMTLLSKGDRGSSFFDECGLSNEYKGSTLEKSIEALYEDFSAEEAAAVSRRTLKAGSYDGRNTDCISGTEVKDALMWPLSTREALGVEEFLRKDDPEITHEPTYPWWLRSPGSSIYAACVDATSNVVYSGYNVDTDYRKVRPALNIDISSVILTSEVGPGKYKLSVSDNEIIAEAKGKLSLSGNTATVSYRIKGEHKDNVDRVSVLITDGKYNADTGWDDKASDDNGEYFILPDENRSFTIPEEYIKKAGGKDYRVYLIAEDINEGKETDLAGIPLELKIDTQEQEEEQEKDPEPEPEPEPEPQPEPKPAREVKPMELNGLTLEGKTPSITLYGPGKTISYNGRAHVWTEEKLNEKKKKKKVPDLDVSVNGIPGSVSFDFVYGKNKDASENKAYLYLKLKPFKASPSYNALDPKVRKKLKKEIKKINKALKNKKNRFYFAIKPLDLSGFTPDSEKSKAGVLEFYRKGLKSDTLTLTIKPGKKGTEPVWDEKTVKKAVLTGTIAGYTFRIPKKQYTVKVTDGKVTVEGKGKNLTGKAKDLKEET